MIKLAGAACILAAGLLAGLGMEMRLKKRAAILREMAEIFALLEKEMSYHRAPVPEAFHSAAKRCSTEVKEVLEDAAAKASLREGNSFADIWRQAVYRKLPPGVLGPDETELICESAAALCNTDTILQRTLLEKYADRFQALGKIAAGEAREKGNLYRRLAMAAGVFLIILFL